MTDFNLAAIKKYYHFKSKNGSQYFQTIGEDTAVDLDLDFLFFKLDRTLSKIGRQYFYSKFRIIETTKDDNLEAYEQYFEKNTNLYIVKELQKLNHYRDYDIIDLIDTEIYSNPKYLSYAKLSNIALLIIIFLSLINSQMLLFLLPLFFTNAFFHYRNKSYVEYHNQIIFRLYKTLSIAERLHNVNKVFEEEYKSIKLKKLKTSIGLASFNHQLASNEFMFFFWLIWEVIQITFNLEILRFNANIKTLHNSKFELVKLFEYIGKIDTAITLQKIKTEFATCVPEFINHKEIEVLQLYHPLIDHCIGNDLKLTDRSIAITGSNMSGKTSFMRSIGVNTIIAQSLGFCFATKYKAPFMRVLSSINVQDDINENKSFYLEEVLRIKVFLDSTEGFNLILIDEIFSGTNTRERIAISKSVLKHLNTKSNIIFMTTHDLEIAQYLEAHNYDLYHFPEDIKNDKLSFSYQLRPGINTKTNAIEILKLYSYPTDILNSIYKNLGNPQTTPI